MSIYLKDILNNSEIRADIWKLLLRIYSVESFEELIKKIYQQKPKKYSMESLLPLVKTCRGLLLNAEKTNIETRLLVLRRQWRRKYNIDIDVNTIFYDLFNTSGEINDLSIRAIDRAFTNNTAELQKIIDIENANIQDEIRRIDDLLEYPDIYNAIMHMFFQLYSLDFFKYLLYDFRKNTDNKDFSFNKFKHTIILNPILLLGYYSENEIFNIFRNICNKYSKEYELNINVDIVFLSLFRSYDPLSSTVERLLITVIKSNFNKFKSQLLELFNSLQVRPYDPYHFYLLKDSVGDVQYSSRSPYNFSSNRTSPIVVINDKVETTVEDLDASETHHYDLIMSYKVKNNIDNDLYFDTSGTESIPENARVTETAAGSVFNKVVLLEYAHGDINKINNTLLSKGYKKVYINNKVKWTDREYKRIAKFKRLLTRIG